METKDELLDQLEIYPAEDVGAVLARVSGAIGADNAPSIDVEEHALRVTRDVLRGRCRDQLQRELEPRLATSTDLLWLFDEDEVLLAVSPAAARSLDYTPDELRGRSAAMLAGDPEDVRDGRRARLRAYGRDEGVVQLRTKDGELRAFVFDVRRIRRAGQRLAFVRTRPAPAHARKRLRERLHLRAAAQERTAGIMAGLLACLCERIAAIEQAAF